MAQHRAAALGCPGPSHRRGRENPLCLGRRSRRRGAGAFFMRGPSCRPRWRSPRRRVRPRAAPDAACSTPPLTQNGPRLRLAITDSGHRLDDVGYPRQGTHSAVKAVRRGPLAGPLPWPAARRTASATDPPGQHRPVRSCPRRGDPMPARRGLRRTPSTSPHRPDACRGRTYPPQPSAGPAEPASPAAHAPSAGTRPPPTSRPCHTPIVLPRNTNPAEQLTVLPKHL